MRPLIAAFALTTLLCAPVHAELPDIAAASTIEGVLNTQKGKRVTLRLRSGQDLTGTLSEVSRTIVHLTKLSGREFYDAAIAVEAIESVQVRNR